MRFLVRGFMWFHTTVYRLSRGRFLGKLRGAPVLLLTTTGRRTGARRTRPLMYLTEGEAYVIVASNNGGPRNPAWYRNLQSNPNATLEVRGRKLSVRAETAQGAERERLWAAFTGAYAFYMRYQEKTDRQIPVVVLRET